MIPKTFAEDSNLGTQPAQEPVDKLLTQRPSDPQASHAASRCSALGSAAPGGMDIGFTGHRMTQPRTPPPESAPASRHGCAREPLRCAQATAALHAR